MKHIQKILTVIICLIGSLHISNSLQSYPSYSYSTYFSSEQVFDMVLYNDVYGIELWLRNYPYVDIRNYAGQTPFMLAVRLQHYSIAKLLLLAGANRYATDDMGRNAYGYAYDYYHTGYCNQTPPSLDASTVLTSLGIGVAAGLVAYAINNSNTEKGYCPGCGMTRYVGESMYCDSCCARLY